MNRLLFEIYIPLMTLFLAVVTVTVCWTQSSSFYINSLRSTLAR